MKAKIRALFVLVILVFIVELVITLKFEQPYPAILFPAFGDIPTVSRSLKKPTLKVFFYNHDSLEVTPEDLFYRLSPTLSGYILKENFTEKNSFFIPSKIRKEVSLNVGLNNFKIKLNNIRNKKQMEKGVSWLKNRLTKMLNRTDLDRFEVQWYNLSLDSANTQVNNSLAEKFIINFN